MIANKERKNIYEYIVAEENAYNTLPVAVVENYEWNMRLHIIKSILYKNSQYITGKDEQKPFKNITRPILNLQYRAEGFDVKDIVLFVNDPENYYKSFLVKKFHEKWARKNKIDTFIDKLVESFVDFGAGLVKDINEVSPEVVPLQRIAFCDQTDLLSGVIAEKHFYAPDQLKELESKGWGSAKNGATGTVDDVIALSDNYKKVNQNTAKKARTPGKYIEVYEIHGVFPKWWLDDSIPGEGDDYKEEYVRQLHIVALYKDQNDNKQGITLFRGKEKELPYKLILRDEIYGRALGFGGAEELFEPQVWVNYDMIHMKGLKEAASKVLYQTDDTAFANRNKTMGLDNGEILITEEGKSISQINTQPVNIVVFENSIKEWEAHAQQMGAANDSIMGVSPTSGTPFKLQELVTEEAHSLHEYRKGKLATFVDEIYQDWIMPYLAKEITNGDTFISELDLDELQGIAENVVNCEVNDAIKQKILAGQVFYPDQVEQFKQEIKKSFMNGGNKRFIEILKGEMKDAPIDVEINIAGKQKNLSQMTDKLVNIFRQILQAPQILQSPPMAKLFNNILESSGLDPLDFSGFTVPTPQGQAPSPPDQIQPPLTLNQPVAQVAQ